MGKSAVGIKNCKQLFSRRFAFTTEKIFWVVNENSCEKSCLQFSIPTWSELGGGGGDLFHVVFIQKIVFSNPRTSYRYQVSRKVVEF